MTIIKYKVQLSLWDFYFFAFAKITYLNSQYKTTIREVSSGYKQKSCLEVCQQE